jgi:hypothetical protein
MSIDRAWLVRHFLVTVALFVIASPLGDKQHGIGKHNAFAATVGQSFFVLFLVSLALFVVAAVVSLVQYTARRTRQSAATR